MRPSSRGGATAWPRAEVARPRDQARDRATGGEDASSVPRRRESSRAPGILRALHAAFSARRFTTTPDRRPGPPCPRAPPPAFPPRCSLRTTSPPPGRPSGASDRRSWLTMMQVVPSRFLASSRSVICAISPTVSPANTSSRSRTSGPVASVRASSSLRRSPIESCPGSMSASRSPNPTLPMMPRSASAGGACVISRQMLSGIIATRTFSRTDISPNGRGTCQVRAIPRPTRSCMGRRVMSSPRKSTLPESGRCSPMRIPNAVDFPAPFGPIRPSDSPAST